jgi:hypothetical protein
MSERIVQLSASPCVDRDLKTGLMIFQTKRPRDGPVRHVASDSPGLGGGVQHGTLRVVGLSMLAPQAWGAVSAPHGYRAFDSQAAMFVSTGLRPRRLTAVVSGTGLLLADSFAFVTRLVATSLAVAAFAFTG